MEHRKRKFLSLLFFLLLVFLIAALGGFATHHSIDPWYKELHKASWTPPAWVFSPVWTILYILIALSGWLLFLKPKSDRRKKALLFFFLQLFCNGIWSFLFFYFRNPFLGLVDIMILSVLIPVTLIAAKPVSRGAAYLLIPYLIWTLYALTLNAAIVFYLL